MSHRLASCIISVAVLLLPTTLQAAPITIYSSLGPGNTFQTNSAWQVFGSNSGNGLFEEAATFKPSSSVLLTQIDIALAWFGGTNSVVVTLNSDSGGFPGSAIASWTVNNLSFFGTLQTLLPSTTLSLAAGQSYWIVA